MNDPSELLRHYERHLGQLVGRYRPFGDHGDFWQSLRFDSIPETEASTIVTLGLSKHVLRQKSGRPIRQELLTCTYTKQVSGEFTSAFDVVARQLAESREPLPRGQVVGPAGRIVADSSLEAFVATNPWYWPDSFSAFFGTDPPVYLVWLVPITSGEAGLIREKGLGEFEELVERRDPDLLDLFRDSCLAAVS